MENNTNPQPNIEEIRDLLSPYIDGEVTDEERAMVEQALASSEELQDELDLLQQTVSLVSALPPMPAPRPFTLTEADVQAVAPTPKKRAWWPAWAGGLAMVAATLLCVLIAGGVFFGSQMGSGGSAPAAEIAMQQESAAPAEAPMEKQAETAVTAGEATADEDGEAQANRVEAEPETEEAAAEEVAEEETFEAAEAEMAPAEEPAMEEPAEEPVLESAEAEIAPAEEMAMEDAAGEAADAPLADAIEEEAAETGADDAMMAETDQDFADEAAEAAPPMPAAPADENALSLTAPAQSESADAARSGIAATASPPPPAPIAKEEALPEDLVEAEEEVAEEKMIGGAEAPAAPDMEGADTATEEQLPQEQSTEPPATNTPSPTATALAQPANTPTAIPEVKPTEATPPTEQTGWVSPGILFVGVVILSALVILIVAALIIWVSMKNRNQ